VSRKSLNDFLSSVKAVLNDSLFYPRIFALVARECRAERKKLKDPSFEFLTEEYEELSRRLDKSQIQESCSVRNVLRTKNLADLLINEKGDLRTDLIPGLIDRLKSNLYSLGPNRQYDAKRQEHILSVLNQLVNNKEVVLLLKKIDRPYSNKLAEDLIRQTLLLPSSFIALTDVHAKRAVLAAWFCLLRQNVGSCFATAPAEIIQAEQPELFLQDLIDLLTFCSLKRTFEGIEYSVPLSDTWGNGDLKKPLVVKKTSQGISPEIWYSPGLIAAFEAMGLLAKNEADKNKIIQLKKWLERIFKQKCYDSYYITTAEEIIRIVLLETLGLSEQSLKEYENRPRDMMQSQLFILPVNKTKLSMTIGEKCSNFYSFFDQAKNAFKALADNPLLKAWEFTLASFSETKLEFTSWNLYAGLGMSADEPGGIGEQIQSKIQSKLNQINALTQDLQYECEAAYAQVKTLESRLRHTSGEKEMQWLKMDYQNRLNQYQLLEDQRNIARQKAQAFVHLYDTLYESYIELFKEYFQEVYDADMQEVQSNPFDDSPAGFRLLYKHGRNNPSQWTRLRGLNDYVESLTSFFVATEPHITSLIDKEVERDFAEIVSNIITYIRTKEFQETAFYRMATAHKTSVIQDPLNHLEKIEKKPWSYTSGGTMNTLVNCYYGIGQKPLQEEKWVENEMELLVFIVDTLKLMPYRYLDPYLKKQRFSLLMHSPTHAFLLKPNTYPFYEAWQNDEFTYTSVRDRFVKPAEIFISGLLLDDEMIRYFIEILGEKIPENYQPRFKNVFRDLKGPLTSLSLREMIFDTFEQDKGLQFHKRPVLSIDEVDSALFKHLPFFHTDQLKKRVSQILEHLPGIDQHKREDILKLLENISLSRLSLIMSSHNLQEACKALICIREMSTSTRYDYHFHINQAARKLGYAIPNPLIFADSNWMKDEFGFVVNPGTARLELWRLDYTASVGYPMSSWKEWVNGSRPHGKWGIFVKPPEYGQY